MNNLSRGFLALAFVSAQPGLASAQSVEFLQLAPSGVIECLREAHEAEGSGTAIVGALSCEVELPTAPTGLKSCTARTANDERQYFVQVGSQWRLQFRAASGRFVAVDHVANADEGSESAPTTRISASDGTTDQMVEANFADLALTDVERNIIRSWIAREGVHLCKQSLS